jgi:small subunit ribosomal protein S19
MAKEFLFRGKTVAELKSMPMNEFIELLPARERRTLKRGISKDKKELIKRIEQGTEEKIPRTHHRDMIVLPQMIGKKVRVHNGKEFKVIELQPEMIGHRLGEYALTRRRVKHSDPGIGATRSSKFISLR